MRLGPGLALLGLAGLAAASPVYAQEPVEWHGYAQLRFTDGSDSSSFSIRRAKAWVEGTVPGVTHLHFRMQALFRPASGGALVLQDVYAEYRGGLASVRAGQMVPDFGLERSQPDYQIPLIERASAINTLIPSAATLARDIGAQVTFGASQGAWHASAGLFNGNGANHAANEDRKFLSTARVTYTTHVSPGVAWEVGGSAAYRRTAGLDLSGILGAAGTRFAGSDTRWGLETRVAGPRWQVQAEYLHARLDSASAWGWYALAAYSVTATDQVVASCEQLRVPNAALGGDPWYVLAFNHFIAGDRAKVMLDGRARFASARTDYQAAAQLQVFFR